MAFGDKKPKRVYRKKKTKLPFKGKKIVRGMSKKGVNSIVKRR